MYGTFHNFPRSLLGSFGKYQKSTKTNLSGILHNTALYGDPENDITQDVKNIQTLGGRKPSKKQKTQKDKLLETHIKSIMFFEFPRLKVYGFSEWVFG